jgi:hypothetical protein
VRNPGMQCHQPASCVAHTHYGQYCPILSVEPLVHSLTAQIPDKPRGRGPSLNYTQALCSPVQSSAATPSKVEVMQCIVHTISTCRLLDACSGSQ